MKGAFLPFKFIGDAAYLMKPWFFHYSKEKITDYLERKYFGILYNQALEWL